MPEEDIPVSPNEQPAAQGQPGKGTEERIEELERLVRGLEAYGAQWRAAYDELRVDYDAATALKGKILNPIVRELQELAFNDHLTGVPNRGGFEHKAEEAIARQIAQIRERNRPEEEERRQEVKSQEILSFIMLDIDHFKRINDKYGHAAGDQVLQKVARVLSQYVRGDDFVGRVGGEEFTLCVSSSDRHVARQVAERVRKAISDMIVNFEGTKVAVTASLGIAKWAQGDTFEETLKRADSAMYRAKKGGRNQVVVDFSLEASQ